MSLKKSVIAGIGFLDELRLYRGERVIETVIELRRTLRNELSPRDRLEKGKGLLRAELATDLFYLLSLPIPMLNDADNVGDETEEYMERYSIIAQLLRHPKLHQIRSYTIADSLVSTVAAASILESLISLLTQGGAGGGSEGGEEGESGDSAERMGKTVRQLEGGKEDFTDKIQDVLDRVLEQARRDTETAKRVKVELLSQLAGTGSVLSFENVADEILKLARMTDISRILEKIEGIEVPGAKGKKIKRRKGWIEGIEIGSDIERLHYSQLALPEDYFLVAFAESKLILYSKHEDVSKGPIYVLLDKSGSMVGEKIDWARAVAVALMKKAISESRAFYARYFDSTPYDLIRVGSNPKATDLVNALFNLARVAAGGGTDIMRAVLTACNDIVKGGRARGVSDIILISDGEDRINTSIVKSSLAKAKARLHTVMIQGNNQDLKEVSYRYMAAQKLEDSEIIRVVDFE